VVLASLLLPAVASAKVRTFTLQSGPYRLGHYDTQLPSAQVRTPRLKGYVTNMHAQLVDRRGRRVTIADAMLHHVTFTNLDRLRVDDDCTARRPEPFYGTGEEDQSLDLPDGYGYRLRARDRWRMSAMLMSHRWRARKVFIQYRVTVDTSRRLQGVRPLWVRANGCVPDAAYHVRGGGGPRSVDDRVHRWRVPLTGRIVAAGGHLHAGSRGLQLRDPDCRDRLLFDNKPSYAPADDLLYRAVPRLHEPGPTQTSWFSSRAGIPVARGQRLDLHGLYENAHARQSVMAITHIYVAPGRRKAAGCPPLPDDLRQTPPAPGQRLRSSGSGGQPAALRRPGAT